MDGGTYGHIVLVVTRFVHSVRMESQRLAQAFIWVVTARHSALVKVSCAIVEFTNMMATRACDIEMCHCGQDNDIGLLAIVYELQIEMMQREHKT